MKFGVPTAEQPKRRAVWRQPSEVDAPAVARLYSEAVNSRSRAPALERTALEAPASSDNLARQEPRKQCVPRQEPRNKDINPHRVKYSWKAPVLAKIEHFYNPKRERGIVTNSFPRLRFGLLLRKKWRCPISVAFRSEAVKKWVWLRTSLPFSSEIRLVVRCLTQFFHSLSALASDQHSEEFFGK